MGRTYYRSDSACHINIDKLAVRGMVGGCGCLLCPFNNKGGDLMARKCTICEHPQVDEINRRLIDGKEPNTRIAALFGVTESSLRRHKAEHLPAVLSKAKEAQEITQGDNLLSQVQFLQSKALSILKQAEEAGELRTALTGVREARSCLELLGKVSGRLPPERILVQFEPIINTIIYVLRQEVRDPETLQRISQRLLQEAGSEGGIIDV